MLGFLKKKCYKSCWFWPSVLFIKLPQVSFFSWLIEVNKKNKNKIEELVQICNNTSREMHYGTVVYFETLEWFSFSYNTLKSMETSHMIKIQDLKTGHWD